MTFLELVQKLALEAEVPGGEAAVTTVVGQTGQAARLVNWIQQAYIQIQGRQSGHWDWLRHEFSISTSASDDTYLYTDATDLTTASAIASFSEWYVEDRNNPPKIYLTSAGVGTQRWMSYLSWQDFRAIYDIGTQREGYPIHITIDPQDRLVVGPVPDGDYTITGEFYRAPQVLDVTDDNDTPDMPSQFHYAIVYRALVECGYWEEASNMIQRGERNAMRMIRQLEQNQMPVIGIAPPMA